MKTISLEKAVAMIPNGASLMIGGSWLWEPLSESWMRSSARASAI